MGVNERKYRIYKPKKRKSEPPYNIELELSLYEKEPSPSIPPGDVILGQLDLYLLSKVLGYNLGRKGGRNSLLEYTLSQIRRKSEGSALNKLKQNPSLSKQLASKVDACLKNPEEVRLANTSTEARFIIDILEGKSSKEIFELLAKGTKIRIT